MIEGCNRKWKTQASYLEITFCLYLEQAERCLSYVLFVSRSVASSVPITLKKSGNPGKGGGFLICTTSTCL